ncbi:MAG TPA: hypothetical protein PLQ95_06880 [Thiobacillus sp.]|nr:hypothetical protein [Thiobacillus sp.]
MLLFLDTEFTCIPGNLLSKIPGAGDLNETVCKFPKLISIGLVSKDGKHEFYGEVERGTGWDFLDCSDFVMIEVVPLLKGGEFVMTPAVLKDRLIAWLESIPGEHTLACDSKIDLELVRGLLGQDWPESLAKHHYDLCSAFGDAFDQAFLASLRKRGGSEHNALDDAHANLAGWKAWIRRNRGKLGL